MNKAVSNSLGLILKVFSVTAVIAIGLHLVFITDADMFLNSDFMSFLTGARAISSGDGAKLYDLDTQLEYQKPLKHEYEEERLLYPLERLDSLLPYRNLPVVALPFILFTGLPGLLSFKLFALLNLLLLLFIIYKLKKSEKTDFFVSILVSVSFLPALTSIYRGQLTIPVLLIIYFIYLSLKEKNYLKAGFISGLLMIKIQYLVAIPLLFILARNKPAYIKGFLATTTVFILGSIIISRGGLYDYPAFLLLTEHSDYGSVPTSVLTLFSLVKWAGKSIWLAFIVNFVLYSMVVFTFLKFKNLFSLKSAIIIITFTTLIFGIHMTDNDVVLLLLPLMFVIRSQIRKIYKLAFLTVVLFAPILRFTRYAFFEIIILIVLETALILCILKWKSVFYAGKYVFNK